MHAFPRLSALLFTLLLVTPLRAADADLLGNAKRILFLGDSITNSGQYVDTFEAFLFTQMPDRKIEVINCGLPSETVSGLSEEGHAGGKFPRPDLHERLDRVLAAVKPDLIFACYGMNDGIYKPYDDARAQKFQDGMKLLRAKAEKAGARVVHLTPPVFDPVPISGKVAPAGQEDSNAPYEVYNGVLDRYSTWLVEQRANGWKVIDTHTAMNAALKKQRETDINFTFSKDGVHPSAAGHDVLAHALIEAVDDKRAHDFFGLMQGKDELMKLVRKRGRILTDAWLNEAGHKRPGMGKGLPIAEAQAQAAELEKQIRALVAKP